MADTGDEGRESYAGITVAIAIHRDVVGVKADAAAGGYSPTILRGDLSLEAVADIGAGR